MDTVQLVTFLFTLATFQPVLCDINCSPDKHQFYFKQLQKCRPCDKCIVGEGTDKNSEVKYDSKFGALTCKSCKPCDKGFFNRKRAYNCKPCRNCTVKGRYTLRQCTINKNTVCGDRIQQIVKISTESPNHESTGYTTSNPKSLCTGCNKDNVGISENRKNSKKDDEGADYPFVSTSMSVVLVCALAMITVGTGVVFLTKKGVLAWSWKGKTINSRIQRNGYIPTESRDDCTAEPSPDEFRSLSSFSDANPQYQQIQSEACGDQTDDSFNLGSPLNHSFPTLPSSNTDNTIVSLCFDDGDDTSLKIVDTCKTNGVDGEQNDGSVLSNVSHDPLSQQPLLESNRLATAMTPHFNAGMEDEDSPSSVITTDSEVKTAGPKESRKQTLKTFIRQHSPHLAPNKRFIDVCRTLGVSDRDLDIISIDFQDSVQEQAYRSLIKWTEKYPDASILQLEKALIKNNLGHIYQWV